MFHDFVSQGEVSYAVETNRAIAPVSQRGGLFMCSAQRRVCIAPQGPY